MKKLKVNLHLEANNMGADQGEIAEYVSNHNSWIEYADAINAAGIPANPEDSSLPSDAWLDSQEFHPDELITEACKNLGWHSVPQCGGLGMSFTLKTMINKVNT